MRSGWMMGLCPVGGGVDGAPAPPIRRPYWSVGAARSRWKHHPTSDLSYVTCLSLSLSLLLYSISLGSLLRVLPAAIVSSSLSQKEKGGKSRTGRMLYTRPEGGGGG